MCSRSTRGPLGPVPVPRVEPVDRGAHNRSAIKDFFAAGARRRARAAGTRLPDDLDRLRGPVAPGRSTAPLLLANSRTSAACAASGHFPPRGRGRKKPLCERARRVSLRGCPPRGRERTPAASATFPQRPTQRRNLPVCSAFKYRHGDSKGGARASKPQFWHSDTATGIRTTGHDWSQSRFGLLERCVLPLRTATDRILRLSTFPQLSPTRGERRGTDCAAYAGAGAARGGANGIPVCLSRVEETQAEWPAVAGTTVPSRRHGVDHHRVFDALWSAGTT